MSDGHPRADVVKKIKEQCQRKKNAGWDGQSRH